MYCASVRFIPSRQSSSLNNAKGRFVPLDSSAAARHEGDGHPPIFCIVFRRTRNVPGDECHCFITKTKQSALVLVQACFAGYTRTGQFQNIAKAPLYIKGRGQNWMEIKDEIKVIEAPTSTSVIDFMTNPKSCGFFYITSKTRIESWQLWDEEKSGRLVETKKKNRKRKGHHRKSKRKSDTPEEEDSFNSSTEYYYNTNVPSNILIPNHLKEQYVPAGKYASSLESTNVDPYTPAPNLVKVEHVKDPKTGTNVFIRWFDDVSGRNGTKNHKGVRKILESPNVLIKPVSAHHGSEGGTVSREATEERSVGTNREVKLKGILRNRSQSIGKPFVADNNDDDDKDYEISKAYFEDRLGRKHHFSERKLSKIRQRRTSLSDEVRRLYIDPSCGQNDTVNQGGLPIGAKVLKHSARNCTLIHED
ncbi:hypothetical protein ACOME3_007901 [Neoechinorhynchus agilis]